MVTQSVEGGEGRGMIEMKGVVRLFATFLMCGKRDSFGVEFHTYSGLCILNAPHLHSSER